MYTFFVGSRTTEGSRRSPSVVHQRKKVYTFVTPTLLLGGDRRHWRGSGHFFSRVNSSMMLHTPPVGPATANRFFAFASAHTDRKQHIRDWQNVCIMASEKALSADFTTDNDVEWPVQEGNAESSLQTGIKYFA